MKRYLNRNTWCEKKYILCPVARSLKIHSLHLLDWLISVPKSSCRSSTLSGTSWTTYCHMQSDFSHLPSRSMTRGQRGPKRAPTPTSATLPPSELPPSPTNSSPVIPAVKKPLYLCSPFVEAALVKGNFKTIVMLPKYVDIMEWVAVNSMLPRWFINYYDMLTPWTSFWLLHKLEWVLWYYHRVLYSASVSYHVCWPDVRLSLLKVMLCRWFVLQVELHLDKPWP